MNVLFFVEFLCHFQNGFFWNWNKGNKFSLKIPINLSNFSYQMESPGTRKESNKKAKLNLASFHYLQSRNEFESQWSWKKNWKALKEKTNIQTTNEKIWEKSRKVSREKHTSVIKKQHEKLKRSVIWKLKSIQKNIP